MARGWPHRLQQRLGIPLIRFLLHQLIKIGNIVTEQIRDIVLLLHCLLMPLPPLGNKGPRQRSSSRHGFGRSSSARPTSFWLFTSASVLLFQVCLGLPTFLFPWGFQSSACRVTFDGDFAQRVANPPSFPLLDVFFNWGLLLHYALWNTIWLLYDLCLREVKQRGSE